jgi:hypothetical protein
VHPDWSLRIPVPRPRIGGSRLPVTAFREDRSGAIHVRLPAGWRACRLLCTWTGPCWLTLHAALLEPLPGSHPRARHPVVTFTLWRNALGGQAWRRVRVLAARHMRFGAAAVEAE